MAEKAVGIVGGILCILCASGVFAMYWFVLQPANIAYSSGNMQLNLYVLDNKLNITQSSETMLNWSQEVLPNVTMEDFVLIDSAMKLAPISSINFWGVIQLDIFICFIILAAMGAVGGILAMAGAGED